MIKLLEETGYHYHPLYRFYGWEFADTITPVKPCGAKTLGEFYLACRKAWNAETCSAKFRPLWSAENPSVGQCTITAKLVHEFFGGEVLWLPLEGGGRHNFNRIRGVIVDLACEQFGADALLDFPDARPGDPESLVKDPDKAERCELLRGRLAGILFGGQAELPESEALRFTRALRCGWNLGNTFDAFDDAFIGAEPEMETRWCGTRVTKELIHAIVAAGFGMIRIPVSWHNHVDKNFRIHPLWMARVKEVVTWAYEAGLTVILNSHHDMNRAFCYPEKELLPLSEKYIRAVWQQIAEEFAAFDTRLIFEGMNEPRFKDKEGEWCFDAQSAASQEAMACINALNQCFVSTVRAAGGNNAGRYLMVPAYAARPDAAASALFRLPEDSTEGKLIISAHAYSPFTFCLESPGTDVFDSGNAVQTGEILSSIGLLRDSFTAHGIPVILGEFGAQDKHNLESRIACVQYYVSAAKAAGIPCVIWDNSYFESGDEFFGLINRKTAEWVYPEIVKALLEASR